MSVETRRGTMTDTLQAPDVGAPRLAAYNARRIGFAAGVAAAAIMLLAIVLVRLLSGVMSLPEVVAEGLLMLLPGVLFSAVLDSLQHAAKPLFYLAVGIGILIVGGLFGRWYAHRPAWRQVLRLVLRVWLAFCSGVCPILRSRRC